MLTTGTGSGKSLAYILPDRRPGAPDRDARAREQRVRAIIVYPMNALANSQLRELEKFLVTATAEAANRSPSPATPARRDERRRRIRDNPPDILLTNYVMLELMLTRPDDRRSPDRQARGTRFLVFDELHTYRGRQGADVALLVRRVREPARRPACSASAPPPPCLRGQRSSEQQRGRRGRQPSLRHAISPTMSSARPWSGATDEARTRSPPSA